MSALPVIHEPQDTTAFKFRVALAFFAIYILWGTTFFAIRMVVAEMPPLLAAGVRFFTAGILLFGFMYIRGETKPEPRQWRNLLVLALLMFVAEYGPLFWAEKYVPSGIASVLEATIPIFTLVLEMLVLRQQRWRTGLAVAVLLGFAGVGVLLLPGSQQTFGLMPCLAILLGCVSWSFGAVLSRSMSLPQSRPLTAGATMMLGGGMLLMLSSGAGELHSAHAVSLRACLALLYLIVIGSLVSFTAFVWLLAHMPATRVSSHAYVNPIVAVALGYFIAAEPITARTIAATAMVLMSVFLILQKGKTNN